MLATKNVEFVVQGQVTQSNGVVKSVANVFHYILSAPTNLLTTGDINAFLAAVWAPIAAALNPTYIGVATLYRSLDDALNAYIVGAAPASGTGTAGDRLPLRSAVAMLLRTGNRGKNFRGSKHFGPISEADTTLDNLTGGGLTNWQAAQVAVQANFTNAGFTFTPAVLSRSLSQLSSNPTNVVINPLLATPNGVLLNKNIGSMNRRKEKTVR